SACDAAAARSAGRVGAQLGRVPGAAIARANSLRSADCQAAVASRFARQSQSCRSEAERGGRRAGAGGDDRGDPAAQPQARPEIWIGPDPTNAAAWLRPGPPRW